jgi:hypothetical protein
VVIVLYYLNHSYQRLFLIAFISILLLLLLLLLFGVCPSNKHCPSARCAYAANAVGKDLYIFVIGAVYLIYIYTQQRKIVNNICSYS